jgi:hypothetical protein
MRAPRSAADYALTGLATYRLTRLITRDTITAPARDEIWRDHPPHSSKLGYVLTCTWCSSIYAASALEFCRIISPRLTKTAEAILAASAVAGLLTAYEDRD